jgi:hypothetical protein
MIINFWCFVHVPATEQLAARTAKALITESPVVPMPLSSRAAAARAGAVTTMP